ncbi:RidA family protein [Shewanella maritima]|uniref:RidA family protein n=1 Tax=Shewanella maritima TaxID=2520507 RepID=UPI0037367A23
MLAAPISLSVSATDEVEFINSKGQSAYPFSEAVKVGNTMYLSGQLGFDPLTKSLAKGGVGAETKQTLLNIEDSLQRMGYTLSDVVKCTVMLADIKDFSEFNEVYKTMFTAPYPARSTFAVSGLALDAKIEIECIAAK